MPGSFVGSVGARTNTIAHTRVDVAYLEADDFLVEREILKAVEDTWDEANFVSLLELTNRAVVSKRTTFNHYENGLMFRSVGIGSVIAGQTASQATITLTADSYTTVAGVAKSPLKATDILWLGNNVWVYVKSKTSVTPTSGSALNGTAKEDGTPTGTATQFTVVRRNGATEDIGALLTAMVTSGNRASIPSNGHAEGSYQPVEGLDDRSTRYSGQMQIFKQHKAITGTADSLHMTAEVNGSTYKWNKMVPSMLLKHRADINLAMLFSPGGSFTNASNETIRLTTGLEGYIRSLGNNYGYPTAGFVLADLDAIVARVKAEMAGKHFFFILGSTLRGQIEEIIRAFTVNGGINYSAFGSGDAKARMIDLGIDSFVYKGITFHLQETNAFNHPEVTGLAGFNYDKVGFLIPCDMQKITFSVDGNLKTANVSAATIRYLQQSNGVSRRMVQWENDYKTNGGKDERSTDVFSEEGLQLTGLRKFIRVYPV